MGFGYVIRIDNGRMANKLFDKKSDREGMLEE